MQADSSAERILIFVVNFRSVDVFLSVFGETLEKLMSIVPTQIEITSKHW